MRTFSVGSGRIRTLAYSPDSRSLLIDVRGEPTRHPWMGFDCEPARELAWWDWPVGTPLRRFRLRDSLYGPAGALAGIEDRGDWNPERLWHALQKARNSQHEHAAGKSGLPPLNPVANA